MRIATLLHVAFVLVAATLATPLPQKSTPESYNLPTSIQFDGHTQSQAGMRLHMQAPNHPAVVKRAPLRYDLLSEIAKFDFVTDFKMTSKSKKTTPASPDAMKAFPATIKLQQGSFTPTLYKSRHRDVLQVYDEERMKKVERAIGSARDSIDNCKGPTCGEGAISAAIQPGLIHPANQVLNAALDFLHTRQSSAAWNVNAAGTGPIPDLVFNIGQHFAVIELKTPNVLDDTTVHEIMNNLGNYMVHPQGLPVTLGGQDRIRSLVLDGGLQDFRHGRERGTKALEQLISQMYSKEATWGALTSLKHWIILEKKSRGVFKVTHLDGAANGRSIGLDVMLELSFRALGDKVASYRRQPPARCARGRSRSRNGACRMPTQPGAATKLGKNKKPSKAKKIKSNKKGPTTKSGKSTKPGKLNQSGKARKAGKAGTNKNGKTNTTSATRKTKGGKGGKGGKGIEAPGTGRQTTKAPTTSKKGKRPGQKGTVSKPGRKPAAGPRRGKKQNTTGGARPKSNKANTSSSRRRTRKPSNPKSGKKSGRKTRTGTATNSSKKKSKA